MLLTTATLKLVAAMQRALMGQNVATSAFLTAMSRQLFPAASTQAGPPLPPPNPGEFRFAAAESQHPVLSRAVSECIQTLRAGLGPGVQPHLVQLLVDGEKYGNHIEMAPQFVLECLHTRGSMAVPELFGGAASKLVGARPEPPTISLLAAHIPGVEVHTFHAKDATLPTLPDGTWDRLLRTSLLKPAPASAASSASSAAAFAHSSASASAHSSAAEAPAEASPAGTVLQASDSHPRSAAAGNSSGMQEGVRQPSAVGAAAFMLASPHFHQAGQLAARLSAALPAAPLLGGVLRAAAWGQRSLRGALFLGERTFDTGAVGCLLHGPLQMDQIVVRGWQPDMSKFEPDVTRMDMRGRAPCTMSSMMRQLDNHGELEEKARHELAAQLRRYAEAVTSIARQQPSTMGAFSYSSGVTEHEEGHGLAEFLPGTPMQGAKCDSPWGGAEILPHDDEGIIWPVSATTCAVLRTAQPAAAGGGRTVTVEG